MMRIIAGPLCAAGAAALLVGCGADANTDRVGVEQGSAAQPATAAATLAPAQQAYAAVNNRMHTGMQAIDPDPDVAFAQGMIVHHQGAVDMARVMLQHGRDPEMRRFAQGVIDAQTAEIATLNAWLAKRGKAVVAPAAQATGAVPPITDHSAH